jgi:DNA-binding response OmpR family regulator
MVVFGQTAHNSRQYTAPPTFPGVMKSRPHILYVEDDSDTREMMRLFLESAGFKITVVEHPGVALQFFNEERYDAVLLDNWMLEMTGIDLCRKIREVDKSTPIIFCSAAAAKSDADEALSAGAQHYLTKPLDPEDLIRTLRLSMKTTEM